MKTLLVGAVGMLALQVLLVGGFLATQDPGPLLLNPPSELSEDGINTVVLCGEGSGREKLDRMPPDGSLGPWTRGRTIHGSCDIWYHHTVLYNPHAIEECWVGCDYDLFKRWFEL
jgi:hypothetical protein